MSTAHENSLPLLNQKIYGEPAYKLVTDDMTLYNVTLCFHITSPVVISEQDTLQRSLCLMPRQS